MQPLTIALLDGFDDGHHLMYLRQYARALLDLGHRVIELLPDPTRVLPWLATHGGVPRDRLFLQPFQHAPVTSPFWRLRRIWAPLAQWRHAAQAVAEAERQSGWRVDLVFFCWLDSYIVGVSPLCRFGISRIFSRPWSGVFFQPWHLRSPQGDPQHHYGVSTALLRTRRCRSVALLDEGVVDRLQALVNRPVLAFPDATDEALPTTEPALVNRLRTAIGQRKVIGLVGELSRRKGVVPFLKAAAEARDRDWVFLLMGALGDTQRQTYSEDEWAVVQRARNNPPPNVLVVAERIEDERDFNAVILLCDALFAAYETFGHSSGIVTKAACFHKPILVAPGYCMAERVARFRIGLAHEPHDTSGVIEALACLLDPVTLTQRVGAPDFAGCHQAHSQTALRAALERLVAHT